MNFTLKKINDNQTQVFFEDGRFETLTNEELDDFLLPFKADATMNAINQEFE